MPACKPGGVLVRTRYSLISTGTEMMKVCEASMSLLGKARARPDQVAKVVQSVAATIGVAGDLPEGDEQARLLHAAGLLAVRGRRGGRRRRPTTCQVGDLVACAGNEHALHAELNWVPTNLYVPRAGRARPPARGVRHRRIDRDARACAGASRSSATWRW